MARIAGLTNREVIIAAREGRPGHNGRVSLQTYPVDTFRAKFGYLAPHVGWMPDSWGRLLRERWNAGKVTQALVSFQTTIAWHDADYGWIMPDVTYSVITSSKHQGPAWRLHATRHAAPYDATADDMRRVLSGELVFTSKGYGKSRVFTGTRPGPNYVSGIVAVGERIRFRDSDGIVRVGVITRKGSVAGWAMVDGEEVRFEGNRVMGGAI